MRLTDSTYKYIFIFLLCIVLSALLFTANNLSISYNEALNFFVNTSLLTLITNTSTYIFGQSDISLRLPFLLFYLLSILLMYKNTENFFTKQSDRYISLIIFMILPGLISASLLVNSAIIVTFFTLLYIYYYKTEKKHPYILLVLFLFIDNSFAIFFLALFFYSLSKKDTKLLIISLVLFGLSMGIYGFEAAGKPKGFLADTFGTYASIFSPLLFIYFFYSIYRSGIKKQRTLVWYISSTSLLFSLLLSFRQRIYIEDYAPFVVIFLPYMVKIYFHTIRVRLPQFRRKHYNVTALVLAVLILNVLITFINKPLYLIIETPSKHFAYKYNIAKEIASELKKNGINFVNSEDKELLLRLKFYQIEQGDKFYITTRRQYFYDLKLPISYYGKTITTVYIIKEK